MTGAMRTWAGDCKPVPEPVYQAPAAELESADDMDDGASASAQATLPRALPSAFGASTLTASPGSCMQGAGAMRTWAADCSRPVEPEWQSPPAELESADQEGDHKPQCPRPAPVYKTAQDAPSTKLIKGGNGAGYYGYGSVEDLRKTGESAVQFLGLWQQVFAVALGLFVVVLLGQRALGLPTSSSSSMSPSRSAPQPFLQRQYQHGQGLPVPTTALAEDDFSNSSWQRARLDGSWVAAFDDGTESHYNFDANGHVMVEMPSSALPRAWKLFDAAFLEEGDDVAPPAWMSVKDAQAQCSSNPGCKGLTFDKNQTKEDLYFIYTKSVSTLNPSPGTSWQAYIQDQSQPVQRSIAVSGALVQEPGQTEQQFQVFRFGLHDAAPHLFPPGAFERISIEGSRMLHVERSIPGTDLVNGSGIMRE